VTRPQHATRIIVGLDPDHAHDDLILTAALGQAQSINAVLSVVHAIAPDPAGPGTRASRQARERTATEELHRRLSGSLHGRDRHRDGGLMAWG
jgi:cyanophycinase-like exopeptidase